ncbi:hypothetical protein SPAB_02143 [Salmonella enterica subsp. enterica serovar Paratyphi B str. SPB7]|uniref:Uncharacterized protein n=1 Tax=Salmonella paratyphi B (strain ATCC BAA-1250 / SPB7) TaxID=1016998 RepID=A0A6C6Z2K5_SALPB|nr:hypothetical protein SPAB_02143 [Salmonella enterica subsp. enterica serovar Paratyphi B str. SPB7]
MRPPSQQSDGLHYHRSDYWLSVFLVTRFLAHLFWYKLKYCKNIDAYYFFCK